MTDCARGYPIHRSVRMCLMRCAAGRIAIGLTELRRWVRSALTGSMSSQLRSSPSPAGVIRGSLFTVSPFFDVVEDRNRHVVGR